MKLVLVDLDNVLRWPAVQAAAEQNGCPVLVVPSPPLDRVPNASPWSVRPIRPEDPRARLPDGRRPDVAVVVGFNTASAEYPHWGAALSPDAVAALAYGFASLVVDDPGDVAYECALTLSAPQAVDDALAHLAARSPFESHAGDLVEVWLLSKDNGLRLRVATTLGRTNVVSSWRGIRTVFFAPAAGFRRTWLSDDGLPTTFAADRWSTPLAGGQDATVDLDPQYPPTDFGQIAVACTRRAHLISQIGRTPDSVAGIARMAEVLLGGDPARVSLRRHSQEDVVQARTLGWLSLPPTWGGGGCQPSALGAGAVYVDAISVTARSRYPAYAVSAANTPLRSEPKSCAVNDDQVPSRPGPVPRAASVQVALTPISGGNMANCRVGDLAADCEHWWAREWVGSRPDTDGWLGRCKAEWPLDLPQPLSCHLGGVGFPAWFQGELIFAAPQVCTGTQRLSDRIAAGVLTHARVAGVTTLVIAIGALAQGHSVDLRLIQDVAAAPPALAAYANRWRNLQRLPILVATPIWGTP